MVDRGMGAYLDRLAKQRADEENKRLNLTYRGREKVYGDPDEVEQSTPAGREARMTSMSPSSPCGPGYEHITAPTSGKTDVLGNPRPRAYYACYSLDSEMGILAIGMRDTVDRDNTLIQYDNITPDVWQALKDSNSTTEFLNTYLDGWPWRRVSAQNLPRKRPDQFQLGAGE
jgi:hypothetical protein